MLFYHISQKMQSQTFKPNVVVFQPRCLQQFKGISVKLFSGLELNLHLENWLYPKCLNVSACLSCRGLLFWLRISRRIHSFSIRALLKLQVFPHDSLPFTLSCPKQSISYHFQLNPCPAPSEGQACASISPPTLSGSSSGHSFTAGVQDTENWAERRDGGIQWNRATLRNHTKMGFNGPSIERF